MIFAARDHWLSIEGSTQWRPPGRSSPGSLRDALDGLRVVRPCGKAARAGHSPEIGAWARRKPNAGGRRAVVAWARKRLERARPWTACRLADYVLRTYRTPTGYHRRRARVRRWSWGARRSASVEIAGAMDRRHQARDRATFRRFRSVQPVSVYTETNTTQRDLVPDDYQRRQTLSGAERYVTPELKAFEEKVLTAAERIEARERVIFEALRERVGRSVARLQCAASLLAQLDVLAALAEVAEREGYTVRSDRRVRGGYYGGRHPVCELRCSRTIHPERFT